MSLGWAIKCYRTRPGSAITQDKLARKTGIPYGRLSKFESDLVVPSEKELKVIGKVIKADPEDIKRIAAAGSPIVAVKS